MVDLIGLVPEFEEVEVCAPESIMDPFGVEAEFKADENQALRLIQDLKLWATAEYDKRRVLRADFDVFVEKIGALTTLQAKTSTRATTLCKFLTPVFKKLDTVEEKLNRIGENVFKAPRPSYSDSVKLPGSRITTSGMINKAHNSSVTIKKLQPRDKIILIKTKPEAAEDSKADQATLRETLRRAIPPEENAKIKRAVNMRSGGILLVLDPKEDKNKILKKLEPHHEKIQVSEPNDRKPRMILYNVPSDLTSDELRDLTLSRNVDVDSAVKTKPEEFKPLFKTGPRNKGEVHWVVECSPRIRNILNDKERIYLDWTSCKVQDYVRLTRCYQCHLFGHSGKSCRAKDPICGHCAEVGHVYKDCKSREEREPSCVNCKRNKVQDSNHSVNSSSCPSYKRAVELLIEKTNYGLDV